MKSLALISYFEKKTGFNDFYRINASTDEELRKEYTTKFYEENGVAFSESDLMHEIEDRAYVGRDFMSQDAYKLGEAWVAITDFLVRAEKITADNAPNVAASINTEIISNATGMDIN